MSADDYDFDSLAHKSREELPDERPTPPGHWRLQVVKGEIRDTADRGTNAPIMEGVFTSRLVEPTDDVNADLLDGYEYKGEVVSYRIPVFRPKEVHNIRRFAEMLGVDTSKGGAVDWAAGTKGGTYIAEVVHRTNKDDPERPYVDVKRAQKDEG